VGDMKKLPKLLDESFVKTYSHNTILFCEPIIGCSSEAQAQRISTAIKAIVEKERGRK
jgi:hypothetical protein